MHRTNFEDAENEAAVDDDVMYFSIIKYEINLRISYYTITTGFLH